MSGFIFVPIVRVRNVGFLAIVRNVVCTNCRGAAACENSSNVFSNLRSFQRSIELQCEQFEPIGFRSEIVWEFI